MTSVVLLEESLPESSIDNLCFIHERQPELLSYAVGSLTRDATEQAYGYAQTRMLAAGIGLCLVRHYEKFELEDHDADQGEYLFVGITRSAWIECVQCPSMDCSFVSTCMYLGVPPIFVSRTHSPTRDLRSN